ncbi:MAG: hypothetical protein CMP49_05455 [Flavobacteriales bacterium]|nr:hypothetical protein [Flavobacteriales bacterium]
MKIIIVLIFIGLFFIISVYSMRANKKRKKLLESLKDDNDRRLYIILEYVKTNNTILLIWLFLMLLGIVGYSLLLLS